MLLLMGLVTGWFLFVGAVVWRFAPWARAELDLDHLPRTARAEVEVAAQEEPTALSRRPEEIAALIRLSRTRELLENALPADPTTRVDVTRRAAATWESGVPSSIDGAPVSSSRRIRSHRFGSVVYITTERR